MVSEHTPFQSGCMKITGRFALAPSSATIMPSNCLPLTWYGTFFSYIMLSLLLALDDRHARRGHAGGSPGNSLTITITVIRAESFVVYRGALNKAATASI